jgi:anti-repressor protein
MLQTTDIADFAALVPITNGRIGSEVVATVDARRLHAALKVRSAFKDWIARRLEEYAFSEGQDFCSFLSESSGGRPSKEYALTIDTAKELSMVEKNDEGKKARLYFIECERRTKQAPVETDEILLSRGLLIAMGKLDEAKQQIATLAPKAEAFDRIAAADGSMCVRDAAKALQVRPKDLTAYLEQNGWVYRRAGTTKLCAYQARIIAGDMHHKVSTVLLPDGSERLSEQARILPRGLTKLAKLLSPSLALVKQEAA